MAISDRLQDVDGIAALRALDHRFRPLTMADRQVLPVLEPLVPVLAGGGLRRGSTVAVDGMAATSLALALVGAASAQGSWVAAVGLPRIGLAAAAELGVALDRVVLVPQVPAGSWPTVVAALVDAVDVVLAGPARVRHRDARRVLARARERGAVLVPIGGWWPEVPDVAMSTGSARWVGLGAGHGHLQARRVRVEVTGRREAARPRSVELWCPADGGGVSAVHHPTTRSVRPPLRSVG